MCIVIVFVNIPKSRLVMKVNELHHKLHRLLCILLSIHVLVYAKKAEIFT